MTSSARTDTEAALGVERISAVCIFLKMEDLDVVCYTKSIFSWATAAMAPRASFVACREMEQELGFVAC